MGSCAVMPYEGFIYGLAIGVLIIAPQFLDYTPVDKPVYKQFQNKHLHVLKEVNR